MEVAALRKNSRFLLPRTILEAEGDLSRDLIAVSDLGQVSGCDWDALHRAEYQKAMNQACSVTHRDRRRGCCGAGKDTTGNQQNGKKAGAQDSNLTSPSDGAVLRCAYHRGGLRNLLDGSSEGNGHFRANRCCGAKIKCFVFESEFIRLSCRIPCLRSSRRKPRRARRFAKSKSPPSGAATCW